ncbi:aldehyde dehydrogenase (NADP(+)) [Arthrobacter cupressi]|uniref:NADP-dependent aldehyde dehydrogenase n=1 Tax=Arthrobacter cupressi TaxID=1045773 RepID=A0A1G8QEN1_9MICC|nr:aldehyde dehydrogenase (NADP(+)) [Arthrobacter cupressi]NYD78117.1 NADP-dependent aldehyde dehydrogenase [Arthrobacter cupressi]SDJ03161.1 NADP-dependent aldehyde dehydrogenase [Arthrobacter cupressi]
MTAITQSTTGAAAGTTDAELEQHLAAAHAAAAPLATLRPAERAALLDAVADALDAAADELVPLARQETRLAEARLHGEQKRTTFQLRLFGEVLRDGGYLDARIDHADPDWPMGAPRPELRRLKVPVGPVVVFAASNFPFAFSVAGGDTASALAAGNPVILKAHSGHPELSKATAAVVVSALAAAGAPEGTFALITGTAAGAAALKDPRIKAGAFTGSIPGGRALFDIASSRPEPIPFFGELGSNNPVFVTEAAAAERGAEIAEAFVASFTMGAGQFCTKPGTLFVPASSAMVEALRGAALPGAAPLLNSRIQSGYAEVLQELQANPRLEVLAQGEEPLADPPAPTLLLTSAADMLAEPHALQAECFGPTAVVVAYDDESRLAEIAETFEGQLTATIHGTDTCQVAGLVEVLARKAGRVLWNQWPTGVSVTYAQQHGGPYPATTAAGSTSVGTAAIERFLRPVAYQGFPQHLLPEAVREDNPLAVPRLVDGRREG